MQLPFINMENAVGGRSLGGKFRSMVLDMLSLRCLSANQMDVSSRQLAVSESGMDRRGLGWRGKVDSCQRTYGV